MNRIKDIFSCHSCSSTDDLDDIDIDGQSHCAIAPIDRIRVCPVFANAACFAGATSTHLSSYPEPAEFYFKGIFLMLNLTKIRLFEIHQNRKRYLLVIIKDVPPLA